jgi:hypothetical protein
MTSREEYGNGGHPDDIGIDGDGIGSGGDASVLERRAGRLNRLSPT